jgi:hypothetical protein
MGARRLGDGPTVDVTDTEGNALMVSATIG